MAYRLLKRESVADGVRRAAAEETAAAAAALVERAVAIGERVHRARRSCKRVRALLRLVREGAQRVWESENIWYRDTARLLAGSRDLAAMADACGRLAEGEGKDAAAVMLRLRAALLAALRSREDSEVAVEEAISRLREALDRIPDWEIRGAGAMWRGFGAVYRAARKGMAAARDERSAEAFHDWRRDVKDHWYHVRFLRGVRRGRMADRADGLEELGEWLGFHHDLAMLAAAARGEGVAIRLSARDRRVAADVVERAERAVEERVFPLAAPLFRARPADAVSEGRARWRRWRGR